jgi:hypothetical protein
VSAAAVLVSRDRCPYRSTVIPTFECRSIVETSARGTPAPIISVAARWRRSWIRTWGSPACSVRDWKSRSSFSGRIGSPFSRAKTRQLSS